MSDNDYTIEARLEEASEQLVTSFSRLDTEAELRAVRGGSGPAPRARETQWRPRWLAVAAAVALLAGGTVAIAVSLSLRGEKDSTPSIATTPGTAPVATSTPAVTEPIATDPTQTAAAAATTEPSVPVVPVTTGPPTTMPPTTMPATTVSDTGVPVVDSPNDVFVTVSGEVGAVIDVRDADEVVASFDLSCPENRDCVVQSARVMGDTIWVAIIDTEPGRADAIVRSRVVSVSRSSGVVREHLALDGAAEVRSAGLGADGVLYAHLDGHTVTQPADRQLVAIERGEVRVLETGVSGFRLSDNGRFFAVSFSDPPAGAPARIEVTDLVDQRTSDFETTVHFNEGPGAWSPDGRYLIVNEQWEDQTAWVIDPWSGSGEPIPGTERFLDGACFMNNRVVAHRTWDVGYGQGDAQPGVIRLTSLDSGSTVAEIGDDLFGDGFRCHPDGSISYLRRPVVDVELSPDFSQLEPDYQAPVELVHITPDGTTSVTASGDLRMV